MPQEQHVDRTTIEFAGKADASLSGAANAAVRELGRVEKASMQASRLMTAGFAKAEVGIIRSIGSMSSKILGWTIGLATAAAGFESLKGFVKETMDAFASEKTAQTTRELTAALLNNRTVAAGGARALNGQLEQIDKISSKMEKYSAINESIYRSSYATLATFGLQASQIARLSTGMADILTKQTHGKATLQDANDLAEKIGRALSSHKLGRLGTALGLTKEEIANFAHAKNTFEAIGILQKAMEAHAGGQAKAFHDSVAGAKQLAAIEKERAEAIPGKVFTHIATKWKTTTDRMMAEFLPKFEPAIDAIGAAFDRMMETIEKLGASLSAPELAGFWKQWNNDITKFGDFLKPIGDEISKAFTVDYLTKDWKDFVGMLQADMHTIETVVGWIQKIGKAFDVSARAVEDFGKAFRNSINLTEPGKIQHSNLGRGEWDPRKAFPGIEQKPAPGPSLWHIPDQSQEPNKAPDRNLLYDHWSSRMEAKVAGLNSKAVKDNTDAQIKLNPVLESVKRANEVVKESLRMLNDAAISATMSLKGMFPSGSIGRNYGLHGALSDVPGAVYEQYKSEGHAAQYGPKNNYLFGSDVDSEIGVGPALMAQKGLKQGDWVTIPGHPELGRRQIRESSERPHGIEFATPEGEKGRYSKYNKLDVQKAGPPQSSIQYSPTIHVHGHADKAAIANIHSLLEDHSQDLLRRLRAADMEDYRTSFA